MSHRPEDRPRTLLRDLAFGVAVGVATIVLMPGISFANNDIGGPWHWGDGSNPRAFVTVADFTGPVWPVFAATNEWATEPNIDVYYVFEGCGSQGHCIDVRVQSQEPACTTSGGFAELHLNDAGTHLGEDLTKVRLNSKCGGGAFTNRDRRALICEELGHIMGLDHAGSPNDTCMASGNITLLHEHPRPHDFAMLHDEIYDHNDP